MKYSANKKRKSLAYINIAEYDFAYAFLPVLRNQDICAERSSNKLTTGLCRALTTQRRKTFSQPHFLILIHPQFHNFDSSAKVLLPKCNFSPHVWIISVPVLWSGVACAPWRAAVGAAGAAAAGRTAPVAAGRRSGSRQGGAAGGEGGPDPHTQEARDRTAPERLEEEMVRKEKCEGFFSPNFSPLETHFE